MINGEAFIPSCLKQTYISKKHIQPFSEVPNATADGYLSYVYLRYADILLFKPKR